MKRMTHYNHKEDEIIKSLTSQGYTDKEIAERIGRTEGSVSSRKTLLRKNGMVFEGIHSKNKFPKKVDVSERKEEQIAMKPYCENPFEVLAKKLEEIDVRFEAARQRLKEAEEAYRAAKAERDMFNSTLRKFAESTAEDDRPLKRTAEE